MIPAGLEGDQDAVALVAVALGKDVGFEDDLAVAINDDRAVAGDVEFQLAGSGRPIFRPRIDVLLVDGVGEEPIKVDLVPVLFVAQDAALAVGAVGKRMRRILADETSGDGGEGTFNLHAHLRACMLS
jgi:hypothetical protein